MQLCDQYRAMAAAFEQQGLDLQQVADTAQWFDTGEGAGQGAGTRGEDGCWISHLQ